MRTVLMEKELFRQVADDEDDDGDSPILEQIRRRSIVAVFTDDENDDYFLFRADRQPETLEKNEQDDWGNLCRKGTCVVRGLYYRKINNTLSFSLVRKKGPYISKLYFICHNRSPGDRQTCHSGGGTRVHSCNGCREFRRAVNMSSLFNLEYLRLRSFKQKKKESNRN